MRPNLWGVESKRFGVAGISALLALVGCGAPRPVSPTSSATSTAPTPVRQVLVQATELPRATVQPATVHAYFLTELRPKLSGYVHEVLADIGQAVADGEVLARISVPELEVQREILAARLESAKAQEARFAAGVQLAESTLAAAQARWAQTSSEAAKADAALAAAEAEYTRTADLVQRRSLEGRLLDEARMRRDAARAEKEALASAVVSAEAEVRVANAQLEVARVDLQAAQAETQVATHKLEEIDILLQYTEIRAPFDGLVTDRLVEQGELVAAEGQPLFIVAQVDKVRVHIPVPESESASVQVGDPVELAFPAFPQEKTWSASITRLAGRLDPSTRTMLVECEVENEELKLLPGMFGQATIRMQRGGVAAVLPARAVRFSEGGEAYVYIIEKGNSVRRAPIVTGADDGQWIQVVSGVSPGTPVVDAHLSRFQDGDAVTVLD